MELEKTPKYFLRKGGFDKAENESLEGCEKFPIDACRDSHRRPVCAAHRSGAEVRPVASSEATPRPRCAVGKAR